MKLTIMDGFKLGIGLWLASALVGTVWVIVMLLIVSAMMD